MKHPDLLARAEYEEPGHPGVWGPGQEDPEARKAYDEWLADPSTRSSRPSYTWETWR